MDSASINKKMPIVETTASREILLQRRGELQAHAADFVASLSLVPPFPLSHLTELADFLAESLGTDDKTERKLLTIMIHNEAWRETVAMVPFERRLLLLPQCLRSRENCSAQMDEYGLLCNGCGKCPLGQLQYEANKLGYIILIAEGTGAVTGLLQQGWLDAVIGASCFPALEESFAHITEEALPALAVPLLKSGCDNTDVDLQMLDEYIHLSTQPMCSVRSSLEEIRAVVEQWFEPAALRSVLAAAEGHAGKVALQWLSRPGKRWRPLLTASVYDALVEAPGFSTTPLVHNAAVATELFHKASLIHDDIEDDDEFRYGAETMHKRYGVPIALNVGDLLIGEGYGLLVKSEGDDAVRMKMLRVVAEAHRRLCLGQGEELQWMRQPELPATEKLVRIFRDKTAPSFEAAVLLGSIAGGADDKTCAALSEFCQTLGIAYQIQDDLLDMDKDTDWEKEFIQQPSIILALLGQKCSAIERRRIQEFLRQKDGVNPESVNLQAMCEQYNVVPAAKEMLNDFRNRALESLKPLKIVRLKIVLTRLLKKILPNE